MSESGDRAARVIAQHLAKRGYWVVSGLALGTDTAAHVGALQSGGRTIAVLAHGLDHVYPAANRKLAQEILENRGALVAERPLGSRPSRAEFVRRNRIQSGLSLFSIIVESGEKGGAIHQANFTRQQQRPVVVVLARTPGAGTGPS